MKKLLLLLIIFFSSSAFAKEHIIDKRENYFQTSTSYKITPKVNPITGELSEEEIDLVVAGCEPISAKRFYNHTDVYEPRTGGWRYNPEAFFVANFALKQQEIFAAVGDASGGITSFKESGPNTYSCNLTKSFCNFHPDGRTNPLNTKIRCFAVPDPKDKGYFWWRGDITDGSGSKKIFDSGRHCWLDVLTTEVIRVRYEVRVTAYTPNVWTPYQVPIYEEKLPNGNIICYSYGSWKKSKYYPKPPLLTSISVYNASRTKNLGSIAYYYNKDKNENVYGVTAVGSDGRQSFAGCLNTTPVMLQAVQCPHKPPLSYVYQSQWINQVVKPDGRIVKTEYDASGKVSAQYARVGTNDEMLPISRYVYNQTNTEVYDAEGNKTVYHFNEHKQLLSQEVYKDGSVYRIDRMIWDKDTGNLLKKTVENGAQEILQTTDYKYDKNHNPISEKVGDGKEETRQTRTFSDDGFNLKRSETDCGGKIIHYNYLPQTNLLASEFFYEGTILRKRTFHTYDDCAICIKTIIDDGSVEDPLNLAGVTYRKITVIHPKQTLPCFGLPEIVEEKTIDAFGNEILLHKVIYTYAPFGKVLKEDHYDSNDRFRYSIINEYDSKERLISTIDPLGHRSTFQYDDNFNLIQQTGPRKDQKKEWFYDWANRPIEERTWINTSSYLSVRKRFDKTGRIIGQTDQCGNETQYAYDSLDRLIMTKNPDGGTERKEYDVLGNVILEIDPLGNRTKKAYNFRGQPTRIIFPDGSEEHYTYNASTGNLESYKDRNHTTTYYTYDVFDRPVTVKTLSTTGQVLKKKSSTYSSFLKTSDTDEEGHVATYKYDFAGRKIEETLKDRTLRFFYDELGRLYKTQKGDVFIIQTFDLLNRPIETREELANGTRLRFEQYTYDAAGNKTHVTTSKGVSETVYDAVGRPVSEIDPLGNETTHSYSYLDQLIKTSLTPKGIYYITTHDVCRRPSQQLTKNAKGEILQQIEKRYDLNGNLLQEIEHVFEGTIHKNTITHEWNYDCGNRLKSLTEAGIKSTHYEYDEKGRLKRVIKPDLTLLNYDYDELGRLIRYFSFDFDYQYTYDKKDQILKVLEALSKQITTRIYDAYGNIIQETLSNGLTLKNYHDPWGRRLSQQYPDGSETTYIYLGNDLHQISYKDHTFTYEERDLEGHPTHIQLPYSFGSVTIERDALSRVETISSPYYTSRLTYDAVGNLLTQQGKDPLGTFSEHYAYDDLNQLIKENTHSYSSDSLFNRIVKDQKRYEVNTLCQVLSDGFVSHAYDSNGNLIKDGSHTYRYDNQDRLITIETGKQKVIFTYDSFHRRISKKVYQNDRLQSSCHYLWDGDHEIGSLDSLGNIQELRILGSGLGAEIGASVLFELNKKIYVPLHDHRGCVVTLLDCSLKKPLETYRYTAFGEELTDDHLSPWRFSSKRIDPESSLIFFGRRYYHPTLGRFITPDPQGFEDGPNLYAYLHNCPMNDFDLYGLMGWRQTWNNAQSFMWGICEGSAYHFSNMASSFCMRDFSSPGWKPRSLMPNQDKLLSSRGLDFAEKTFLPFTYEARRMGNDVSQYNHMRARGRAFGEQVVTLGGLFSIFSASKGIINGGTRFSESAQFPVQELSRDYLFSGKPSIESSQAIKGSRNRFKADTRAEGAHSVFRRDPITRKITNYETFRPQTNPYDPKPWESVLRFDNPIEPHYHFNKILKKRIYTPHIHDPYCPGGIRPAMPWEIP